MEATYPVQVQNRGKLTSGGSRPASYSTRHQARPQSPGQHGQWAHAHSHPSSVIGIHAEDRASFPRAVLAAQHSAC